MKLSVSLITYNHAAYIAQALDGVLSQRTNFEFEVLVGEDDSSDGTREIVQEYHRRRPDLIRLFLHSRQDVSYINGRPSGRRNLVHNLNQARGEYIALLDGDDYWTSPEKLQRQVEFLDAHPEFASCAHRVLRHEEEGGAEWVWPREEMHECGLAELMRHNPLPTCSVVLRRTAIAPLPEWIWEMQHGDWALHVLCAMSGHIAILNDVMGVYRIHKGGAWSARPRARQFETRIADVHQVMGRFGGRLTADVRSAARESLTSLYFQLAEVLEHEGRVKEARSAMLRAMRYGRRELWSSRANFRKMGRLLFPRGASAYRMAKQATLRIVRPRQHKCEMPTEKASTVDVSDQ